ncbi:MAG: phosphodiester glycosidase family protein [Deinococcales bacterium]
MFAPRSLLLAVLLLLAPASAARAQTGNLYRLPGASVHVSDGAIQLSYGGHQLTYVQGLGWLGNVHADAPRVSADGVLVDGSVLDALGASLPRLADVRFGGNGDVRVVLDVRGMAESELSGLKLEGDVASGNPLTLHLPPMLLPASSPDPYHGVEVSIDPEPGGVQAQLVGPAFHYKVFPLADPTRVVIDLVPQKQAALPALQRTLAPGVQYRRFNAPSASGTSVVHVISVAPGDAELRVVGASREPRTLTQLSSGAVAGINAGYFDPSTFAAVGLLRVDYGMLSLPTRSRAAIAFSPSGATIARLHAHLSLVVDGKSVDVGQSDNGEVGVATAAGALVGGPTVGVLTVQRGVVLGNMVGPRSVPASGFALVYPPDRRALARIDAGSHVTLHLRLQPAPFESAPYVVEAGPLLVKDGQAAYDPAAEGFPKGQRILDAVTQQSAIGVKPDGTVLLVVAQSMRASDLVPLFLRLGAKDAMRLDSGSSATLVADGRPLNRSVERRVVSAIVVRPKQPVASRSAP